MFHCVEFKELDIWYLKDIKEIRKFDYKKGVEKIVRAGFYDRKFYIGKCPVCKKDVGVLVEYRKDDGKKFVDLRVEKKAQELGEICLEQIVYTKQDAICTKGKPYGWTSLEGKEIHDRRGNVSKVRYYESDKRGQRAIYKEFEGNSPFVCKTV